MIYERSLRRNSPRVHKQNEGSYHVEPPFSIHRSDGITVPLQGREKFELKPNHQRFDAGLAADDRVSMVYSPTLSLSFFAVCRVSIIQRGKGESQSIRGIAFMYQDVGSQMQLRSHPSSPVPSLPLPSLCQYTPYTNTLDKIILVHTGNLKFLHSSSEHPLS